MRPNPRRRLAGKGPAAALAFEQSLRGDLTMPENRRVSYYSPNRADNFLPAANPIVIDPGPSLLHAYGFQGVPSYVLIDKEGRIVKRSSSFAAVFALASRIAAE